MLDKRSTKGSTQADRTIASGRRQTGRLMPKTGKVASLIVRPMLSDGLLVRHLADVAALAEAEGDFRLAGHMVDVAYHLAGG